MFVCYRRPTAHLHTVACTQTHTHTQPKFCARILASQRSLRPFFKAGRGRSTLANSVCPMRYTDYTVSAHPENFAAAYTHRRELVEITLCAAIPRSCRLEASEPGLLRPAYRCTRQLIARISGCAGHLGIADTSRGRMGRRRRRPSAPSRCVAEDGVIPSTSSTAPTAHIAHQRPKATSSSHALTAYGTPGPLTAQR